jgi:hypothetical protein
MGEEAISSGRQEALEEVTILLDLAIARSRPVIFWMADLRSWFAGAGKRPRKSSASSRSRTALQTVTFTRR